MSTMDITIFKNEEASNCTNGDFKQCEAINRLSVALKYYSKLNVKNDANDREILRSFMDIYTQMVDDNNHLLSVHGDQLHQIHGYFSQNGGCAMKECVATQRHFASESIINIADDQMMNFWVNLFDGLHFWIYHCYDAGFRVEQNEQNIDVHIDDKTLFDAEFARINTIIRKSDFETAPFERISPQNNDKFVISKAEKGDTTFLDELYKDLSSVMQWIYVQRLREAVNREDYETESLKMDICEYGNIKNCKHSIMQFIKAINGIFYFLFVFCFFFDYF